MSKITSFRLDDDLGGQLEALAASLDRPKSWLIEQAVRSYVQEQSWQVQAIQEALEELDNGQVTLVPHDEVMTRMEQKLTAKLP
jgi:predicted transcriptional regulator